MSYIDRSMSDRLHPGSIVCIFNYRPIAISSFKTLVEYLWFNDNYQTGGAKVLYSYLDETAASIVYVMFATSGSYGDWGVHDQISLYRSTYAVNKSTGTVVFSNSLMRTIQGTSN